MKRKIHVRVSMDEQGIVHVTKVARDGWLLFIAIVQFIMAATSAALSLWSAGAGSFFTAIVVGFCAVCFVAISFIYLHYWRTWPIEPVDNLGKAA